MSDVPLYPVSSDTSSVSERKGNNLKGLMDIYLKARARIWP